MKFSVAAATVAAALGAITAAQDLSILAGSCAAAQFVAASTASGNPCGVSDYLCQCTTGKQFLQDYLTKHLSSNPGSCTSTDIAGLPALGEKFCESVPGYSGSSSSTSAPSSMMSSTVESSAMSSSTAATAATTPAMTPTATPSSYTGAANKQAVGRVAGIVGAVALLAF